ncbi:DUF1642 domain-containing protein [Enterococcus durans]|uniref:DUF1642 domain-containing protein n=2 Tax=Enterococcus durans TaxID=53345 RepID=A0A5N0YHK4_9ENTE|nr:DUF1642 domain-containing protein [Enterococcus durans]KAA9189716.1 DUF1642 domain-containing protein [Enterococcus durans]KAA9202441.1 DUF1642 domain-containing protein [Enterococcus durans]
MNKQELIAKYTTERDKLRPYCPNRNQSEEKLKIGIFTEFIADLKQLDEPQKKIIPKCAHKFIQEGIDSGSDYFTIIICADSFANAKPQDEFSKWLRENSGLFIRSLLNGYEVEKEPLYYVYLPKIIVLSEMMIPDIEGAYLMKSDDEIELADNNDFDDMKFTEQEIKAIDERYWAFAVPVEEVEEG